MIHSVRRRHIPQVGAVIRASAGDVLHFERRESVYPGWIWCTDKNLARAWVPESFVSIEGHTCRMLRDYDSIELEIDVGDKIDVIEIVSGWAWVKDSRNRRGWVPLECLEK